MSVIAIFLNEERFIAEAIESVLAQDFRDFELIIVDDGSTDNSTMIALEYAARHPTLIRYLEHAGHQNRGQSASRNFGLAAARGEFVALLDSDDVWERTKLTQQLAIMDAFPEVDMVCGAAKFWSSWNGGYDEIIHSGHVRNQIVFPPEAALAFYPLGNARSPYPSDILLRREVVFSIGGFEEHFAGPRQMFEDQAFFLKIYLTSPIYFSDRVWFKYRQHADSCRAVVTREGRKHEWRLYFLNWAEAYLDAMPEPPDGRVLAALRRALWIYRHPRLYAVTSRSNQMLKSVSRLGRRLATRAPPFFRRVTDLIIRQ